MGHYWSLDGIQLRDVWLTIGSFDGVHRGHQAIIAQLTAGARRKGVPAVVLCFHPNPAIVLRRRQGPYYLTTPDERADYLQELGVDVVITHPFNREVADLSAQEFMGRLHNHLSMSSLWVGPDFALGRNREGNLDVLRRLGRDFGYTLNVIQPVALDGYVVSSSQIRVALAEGDVGKAQNFLGRPYRIGGVVMHGDGRGRSLGIPTANLNIWPERAIPKTGVYACLANVGGQVLPAVTNVGVRPTFENQLPTPQVETHLLDFDENLYQRRISLDFIARLRDEKRFPSIQALVDQIHQDVESARVILKSVS
jgi:riboflavin kinase/FMN adenylyltransferase